GDRRRGDVLPCVERRGHPIDGAGQRERRLAARTSRVAVVAVVDDSLVIDLPGDGQGEPAPDRVVDPGSPGDERLDVPAGTRRTDPRGQAGEEQGEESPGAKPALAAARRRAESLLDAHGRVAVRSGRWPAMCLRISSSNW